MHDDLLLAFLRLCDAGPADARDDQAALRRVEHRVAVRLIVQRVRYLVLRHEILHGLLGHVAQLCNGLLDRALVGVLRVCRGAEECR